MSHGFLFSVSVTRSFLQSMPCRSLSLKMSVARYLTVNVVCHPSLLTFKLISVVTVNAMLLLDITFLWVYLGYFVMLFILP